MACFSSSGGIIQSLHFNQVYSSLTLVEGDGLDQYFSGLTTKLKVIVKEQDSPMWIFRRMKMLLHGGLEKLPSWAQISVYS